MGIVEIVQFKMHFCNRCTVPINKKTNGFITSCSHIFCEGCFRSTTKNTCPACKAHSSAIAINKSMPKKVMMVFMNTPSMSAHETIKVRRFHLLQYRIMARLTRNRIGRLRHWHGQAQRLKVEQKREAIRRSRIKAIRDMRIQIRTKSSQLFKAMKSGAPVDTIRDLHSSTKRTFERCAQLLAAAERKPVSPSSTQRQ